MKSFKLYMISLAALSGMMLTACDSFIDVPPTGVIDESEAYKEPDKMVNAAYAMLGDCWYNYPFNLWPYGDLGSDDCLKGGWGLGDTGYHPMEMWSTLTSTPGELDELWYRLYCAISRCNRAIVALNEYGVSAIGQEKTNMRLAEVHFLRGHFYFKLITMFRQIPWIDEKVMEDGAWEQTPNNEYTYEELFDKIIKEFEEAYNVLPAEMSEGGRANKIAAAAYLAKCYLTLAYGDGYEATNGVQFINQDYMRKVDEYTKVVKDSRFDYLEDFGDIFLPEYKNSKESVFAVQTSSYEDDNTRFGRCNWSNTLNGCWGIWSCGWDCHKPSQNLVNAFKTENGLPMFDTYADNNAYPEAGVSSTQKWDPRLFHTVGMPSFPYKYEAEYTLTVANSRDPMDYGYYCSMKEVPQRGKGETFEGSWQAFAMNDYVFRYSDVMLMRAEALIELGETTEPMQIINDIRNRAANSIQKHIDYAADFCEIKPYPASYFSNKETARKCLRWERRLEMAMESSRYFDLKRWGIASEVLNKYFMLESKSSRVVPDVNSSTGTTEVHYCQYLKDAHYTAGKNEFYPIPYNQLYYVPDLYVQNKGY